jgi:hypothetical protein
LNGLNSLNILNCQGFPLARPRLAQNFAQQSKINRVIAIGRALNRAALNSGFD